MRGDPLAGPPTHLQATFVAQIKERDPAIVAMRGDAELVFAHIGKLRRIKDERTTGERLRKAGLEEVIGQIEADRKSAEQASSAIENRLIVSGERSAKFRQKLRPIVWTHERFSGQDIGIVRL